MLNAKINHSFFVPTTESTDETDLRCPHCFYYFSSITKPYYLPCSHNLCLDCIESLLSQKQWSNCPICSIPFTKENNNPFQVNLGFLTLVSNILKTKIIFCKKCNKIYNWNEHFSHCDQSEFQEVNETIFEIKTLCEKSLSILKYISYHYNIIQICKGAIYRTLFEAIKNINDRYRKNYSNSINCFLSDIASFNFENAKNEIIKFLETCAPCLSIFNIDENELIDLIEDIKVKTSEININDDTKMNYTYKGKQFNKYQNDFQLKKDLKTSRSPLPVRSNQHKLIIDHKYIKDKSIIINNDDSEVDDDEQIPNEKETERRKEGVLQINNFNNPRVNNYRNNNVKKIVNSNRELNSNNIDLYNSIFHDYNNNNVKVDITDILDDYNDVFNKKKQNKLVISNKGVTKIKVNDYHIDDDNINSNNQKKSKVLGKNSKENNENIYQINYDENEIESSSVCKVKSPYNGTKFLNMHKLNTQNYHDISLSQLTKNNSMNSCTNLHNVSSCTNIFKNNNNFINHSINNNNLRTSFPQNIKKPYNTFSVDLTNTSMTSKKNINPLVIINKLNKTFNKIKDLITKIKSNSFSIDEYSSKIINQIENNNKELSKKITLDYSTLLNDLSYSKNQFQKRYLITFIPNTRTLQLYDAKHNLKSIKTFSEIILNRIIDISVSIAFDDTDLIFISGGKYTPNHFQVIRWSNSKCEINSKLKLKRSFHTSLYFQSKLYLIGGIGGRTQTKEEFHLRECESFSIVNQTWENLPLLNYPRSNSSVCVVNNSLLYVFRGSYWNSMLDTIECLNLRNSESGWTVFQPADPGLSWFGCEYSCAVSYNENKVLIFGGRDNNSDKGYHHCFEFDTESREIYRMKDLKNKAWFKDGTGTFLQNEIIAIKWEENKNENRIHVYNINKNEWNSNN